MKRAIRTAALVGACLLDACGGGKHSAPDTVGTGGGSDAAVTTDAGHALADAGAPAQKPPPTPVVDAGHDAGVSSPPPQSDEDGGPHCTAGQCRAMGDECNVGSCDAAVGECKIERKADGAACGSRVLDNCTAPDTCQAGVCAPHDSPEGTPCGDQGQACHIDDHCDDKGKCVDQGLSSVGTACGDQTTTACDKPDSCDALGVCQANYAVADAPCGDQGKLCNYDDACDGRGQCVNNGVWTLGQCPSDKSKEEPLGCLCGGELLGVCRSAVDVCVAGTCVLGSEPDGTPCGDTATNNECDKPDACAAGDCVPNYAQDGAPCGDRTTDTTCDRPDTCNGAGSCDSHYASASTACGSPVDTECNHADSCDGAGVCQNNVAPLGSACGDQGLTCANNDACDGNGGCTDNGVISPCTLGGTVFGGGAGLGGVIVEILGSNSTSTTTAQDGTFQLPVPLSAQVTLHAGAAPGYFGAVQVRTLTPQAAQQPLDFYLEADADGSAPASAVGLSVDVTKGLLAVTVAGSSLTGSEGATLSAQSAMSVAYVGSAWQYSSTVMSSSGGLLLFYNVAPGTTTVTPISSGSETCGLVGAMASTQFPVFAHTLTSVQITCH